MNFDVFIASVRELLHEDNAPLGLVNGRWQALDRRQLWNIFGSRVFDQHLDVLQQSCIVVLSEIDPQFELSSEERYMASIRGRELQYSNRLRSGLAEVLALIGNFSENLTNCSKNKSQIVPSVVLRALFADANWKLWASLNDLLPILAESAPDEFLNIVERSLANTPCPFDQIFAEEGDGITGGNYMTGLLNALEALSWSEDYICRVAIILGELASHDPGGSWSNRPSNSITSILLPWYPQTFASIDQRISAIKAVMLDFPDIAWEVLLSLLPNQHQASSGTHKPNWFVKLPQSWSLKVEGEEYLAQISAYACLAVKMADEDFGKLSELVSFLDNLPPPAFSRLLEHLSSSRIINLEEKKRLPIWLNLIAFITKHRRHSEAKWALNGDIVAEIEVVANALKPTTPEGLYGRLFTDRSYDLYEEGDDTAKQDELLKDRRREGINEVIAVSGLDGVVAFASMVESPDQVGLSLASILADDMDCSLLPEYLDTGVAEHERLINGFIWQRYQDEGIDWIDNLDRADWTSKQIGELLLSLPFQPVVWDRVSTWLGNNENLYWQQVLVNPYPLDDGFAVAIDKLLSVGRALDAIHCLHCQLQKKLSIDIKQAARALLEAVSLAGPTTALNAYYFIDLIKVLQKSGGLNARELFDIEWAYLSLLERDEDASAEYLEGLLSEDPSFFCEVIQLIYRSKNVPKVDHEPDKDKKKIATNAWRLLRQWRKPPGFSEDGFSTHNFNSWYSEVKGKCIESGHLEVAMITIGEMLFYGPEDPKGLWIDESIAHILNASDAEDMRRGFSTSVFNSRGVHWVDPTGKPERDLADQWREKAKEVDSLGLARFAATLRQIAESYDHDAERIVQDCLSDD